MQNSIPFFDFWCPFWNYFNGNMSGWCDIIDELSFKSLIYKSKSFIN